MDVEASRKTNTLVGIPIDLDLQQSSCEERCTTSTEASVDLYPPDNVCKNRCTINQQNEIDPGRVLPNWSRFSPQDSLNRILDKDYGITDAQKKHIIGALCGDSQAVKAEDQEEWIDGEWEFFHDKCLELGLDPDYCVEDVYEDESGSAQFIAQLAKSGKYFDPVVAKPPKRK
ncbi:hypothetical protein Hanom_Chr15g01337741 [Helianthus anomalus]